MSAVMRPHREDWQEQDLAKCPHKGCDNASLAPHTCPYAEDVGDDFGTKCECCDKCASECADDI